MKKKIIYKLKKNLIIDSFSKSCNKNTSKIKSLIVRFYFSNFWAENRKINFGTKQRKVFMYDVSQFFNGLKKNLIKLTAFSSCWTARGCDAACSYK